MRESIHYRPILNQFLVHNMKVIGICGLARCGKDSLFLMCRDRLKEMGLNSVRFAFADSLKEECNEILEKYVGISAFTEITSEKEVIRPLLVTYGTHVRRKLNPNCWIDKIQNKVTDNIKDKNIVFVTDVRFENEIDWIHSMGGESIHITRGGIVAPNEEESKNDPILRAKSSHQVKWNDFHEESEEYISNIVDTVLQSIS